MLSDHGSVMLHSAACFFYDILIIFLFAIGFCFFWIDPDFLIFTCLVCFVVCFSFFSRFSLFCFPLFVALLRLHLLFLSLLLSLSFSLCPSQSFPLSNIKCPLLPPTQTPLQSTDSTELAHCHPPTSVWPPPLLHPSPPPPLPLRRKRWGPLGREPSSPPSSPPRSPQPFPQSRPE